MIVLWVVVWQLQFIVCTEKEYASKRQVLEDFFGSNTGLQRIRACLVLVEGSSCQKNIPRLADKGFELDAKISGGDNNPAACPKCLKKDRDEEPEPYLWSGQWDKYTERPAAGPGIRRPVFLE
jgi:hypothetical protein